MIRYIYNAQKSPPAPFVRVTLGHPAGGSELRDLPAQVDSGADCTLIPEAIADALGLEFSGSLVIAGVAGKKTKLKLYSVLLGIHDLPVNRHEVLAHPEEPWILLGRDVLNGYRLLLDGPDLALEIG